MQYQQGLQTQRKLINHNTIQAENDFSGRILGNSRQTYQNFVSADSISKDKKAGWLIYQNLGEGQIQKGIEKTGHPNGHMGQNGHGQGAIKSYPQTIVKPPKNYGIMAYILLSVLACLYLETQHFNPLIGDHLSRILDYMAWFDISMILWSYIQTHCISNKVPKMSKFMSHDTIGTQLVDPKYLLTARHCDKCNYFKLPRVSHCSSCGQCIYKLDHHCIWTQTCIGHCNQRAFILFCIYMTIGVLQFWISSVRAVIFIKKQSNLGFFTVFQPGVYIVWFINCLTATTLGIMLFILIVTHILMICTNGTTLDSMKKKAMAPLPFIQWRQRYQKNSMINTFDRGQIQNLRSLFGTNILTFWLPLRRQIQNEFIIEPMNPQPTKLQLMKETNFFDSEMDANNQMYNRCINVKENYKDKKFIIDGEEISI